MRSTVLVTVLLLMFGVLSAPSAQVVSSNIRSGVAQVASIPPNGTVSVTMLTVPTGFNFVVTDVEGTIFSSSAYISDGTDRRWAKWGNVGTTVNFVERHWTTGIVFAAGQTASFVFNAGSGGTGPEELSWSGYLASSAGAAVNNPSFGPSGLRVAPNPAHKGIRVTFVADREENVHCTVHDVQGRLVQDVYAGHVAAGTHNLEWNGRDGSGERVLAGAYFVSVETDHGATTKKLVHIN